MVLTSFSLSVHNPTTAFKRNFRAIDIGNVDNGLFEDGANALSATGNRFLAGHFSPDPKRSPPHSPG
ncbi:hypothetical protein EMIT0194MI4_100003 [Pseudomonas sp. IT-194MI4]|jgi:hypothetical protein